MTTQEDSEIQSILKTLLFLRIHATSEFLPISVNKHFGKVFNATIAAAFPQLWKWLLKFNLKLIKICAHAFVHLLWFWEVTDPTICLLKDTGLPAFHGKWVL